jgi:hypothetical protein
MDDDSYKLNNTSVNAIKDADTIINMINKYKKDWWSENKSKSSSGWTAKQKEAHHNANLLRQRLAEVDTQNTEDVQELVKRNGSTTNYSGQWEAYQYKRQQTKIATKSKAISAKQEEQGNDWSKSAHGGNVRKKAKENLEELQNMDKVTKEEYNRLYKLGSMLKYAQENGRNILEGEIVLKEEEFKKEFRDGTTYDKRDLELNHLNGMYWEAYMASKSKYFKGGSYEGIQMYSSSGNGASMTEMQYYAKYRHVMSLPEYVNLTGGFRDERIHGMTSDEKVQVIGMMAGAGVTAIAIAEVAPVIITHAIMKGSIGLNKGLNLINNSHLGKGFNNLMNNGGFQVAYAGGAVGQGAVVSQGLSVALESDVSMGLTNVALYSNFTNEFGATFDAIKNMNSSGMTPEEPVIPSRSSAFRQAKRDAGVPVNQQPEKVESVEMRSGEHEGNHVIKDEQGNIIYTREYHFTNNSGQKIIIQEHTAGHTKGGQGAHFNVRPIDNTRTGNVDGTLDHYHFKP